jgi:hypothetical protein
MITVTKRHKCRTKSHWAPLERVSLKDVVDRTGKMPPAWCQAIYINDVYLVMMSVPQVSPVLGEVEHFIVQRNDGAPVRDWLHVQRIKAELYGAERCAIEAYPPKSETVNDANVYHLWVLPPGVTLGLQV